MKLETKFMRIPMEVTVGSRFGEWEVVWGYWGRFKLYFLVMVVRLPATQRDYERQKKSRKA